MSVQSPTSPSALHAWHTKQGQPTKTHRVRVELERVKTYMSRLQVSGGESKRHKDGDDQVAL